MIAEVSNNHFIFGDSDFRCTVGRSGIVADKKEGDGGTPAGSFRLVKLFYRADKIEKPETGISTQALSPDDGWCDESDDLNYNQFIKLPYEKSHEKLWHLDDDLYDLIGILDYNYPEAIPGKGSCIFIHVVPETSVSTAGCIALSKEDFLTFLKLATTETIIEVREN